MILREELETIIEAILTRGSKRHITQSGAFLEILKDYSCEGRIEDIADANAIYIDMYPSVAKFIAATLPGIIVSNYFINLQEFSFESFIKWTLTEPEWTKLIKDNFKDREKLRVSVETIIKDVTKYQKDQG